MLLVGGELNYWDIQPSDLFDHKRAFWGGIVYWPIFLAVLTVLNIFSSKRYFKYQIFTSVNISGNVGMKLLSSSKN